MGDNVSRKIPYFVVSCTARDEGSDYNLAGNYVYFASVNMEELHTSLIRDNHGYVHFGTEPMGHTKDSTNLSFVELLGAVPVIKVAPEHITNNQQLAESYTFYFTKFDSKLKDAALGDKITTYRAEYPPKKEREIETSYVKTQPNKVDFIIYRNKIINGKLTPVRTHVRLAYSCLLGASASDFKREDLDRLKELATIQDNLYFRLYDKAQALSEPYRQ